MECLLTEQGALSAPWEVLTDIPSPGFSSNRLLALSDPRHSWGTALVPSSGAVLFESLPMSPTAPGN